MSEIGLNPKLDDLQFQKKITLKKEYRGYKYDAKIGNITDRVKTICKKNKFFELSPHQEFVKRFISFDNPYNGLLLFHGLGSGKTCSAIGITETLRSFYINQPRHKKILIVASPKLQDNYKLQLFDPDKLVKENGVWNITGCVGTQLLDEIGSTKRMSREDIINQVEKIIKEHYSFMGYSKLANTIFNIINGADSRRKLKDTFEGRVIVIDEFHNIRAEEKENEHIKQKTASLLNTLVENVRGMKLIFLTGTPMYNNSKEIVFLLNILNKNDKRPPIQKKELKTMFDSNDNLTEEGKQTLIKYSNGYISYVRGENPYSFPYMVIPKMFNHPNSYHLSDKPTEQFNGNIIQSPIQHLDLYMNNASQIQQQAYNKLMEEISVKFEDRNFSEIESLGYNELIRPIQTLNITYMTDDSFLTGDDGIKYAMDFKPNSIQQDFKYRSGPLEDMFQYDRIGDYSSKIKSIIDIILNSKGIVLVYSQFVYGGIIPMALALEELGFKRNESGRGKSLFKDNKKNINVFNLNGKKNTTKNLPAKYAIISGNQIISPDNSSEIKALTSNKNTEGEMIKVVLITQAGTEGIDMKNLRQIHIMEPWYNLNRLEQVIGRARRNCSHVDLPIEERNFQLYLHSSSLELKNIETVDTMLYRIAEQKSIKMGQVTRVLKSVAIDCLLNINQQKFSGIPDIIKIKVSSGEEIDYSVKDEPFSSICDYMETCNYNCINTTENIIKVDSSTYGYKDTKNNKIIEKIKYLFNKRHVYHYNELITSIKTPTIKNEEIERMLYDLIYKKIQIIDKFGNKGYIVRLSNLFLFQPDELTDPQISLQDRMNPITYKPREVLVDKIINPRKIKIKISETNPGKISETNPGKISETNPGKISETNIEIIQLKELYKIAQQSVSKDDWFSHFNEVREYVKTTISEDKIDSYLISHMCEQLLLSQEVKVLHYLFSIQTLDEFERKLYDYYSNLIFEKDDKKYIGLIDNKNKKEIMILYVLHEELIDTPNTLVWKEASFSEKQTVLFPYKVPLIKTSSQVIGVMGYFKDSFQFKTVAIDNTKRTSTGALFENKGKDEIVSILQNKTILPKLKYTPKSNHTKMFLVILFEILLRYNSETNQNKIFLTKREFYVYSLDKLKK